VNHGQKLYTVCVPFHASVTVMVQADSEEEAKDMAIEHAKPHLCNRCSADIALGELDGRTEIIATEIDPPSRDRRDDGGHHGSAHAYGPA
jgi:hypothetical protein